MNVCNSVYAMQKADVSVFVGQQSYCMGLVVDSDISCSSKVTEPTITTTLFRGIIATISTKTILGDVVPARKRN